MVHDKAVGAAAELADAGHGIDDLIGGDRPGISASERHDAERAAMIASGLHLHEGAGTALEAFDEIKERHEFITAQKEDLIKEEATAIGSLPVAVTNNAVAFVSDSSGSMFFNSMVIFVTASVTAFVIDSAISSMSMCM